MPEIKRYTTDTMTDTTRGMNGSSNHNVSVGKVVSAGLSGLAGGAAIASAIIGTAGVVAVIAGSLVAAAITGTAEYTREKREKIAQ
jgi:hypothetical protein